MLSLAGDLRSRLFGAGAHTPRVSGGHTHHPATSRICSTATWLGTHLLSLASLALFREHVVFAELVSRRAEQLMQKSVQWRKSFGFHHGHCHCLCTCWRVLCQVPMGDKASASRDSLPRCLSWPCGSLGQIFLGSLHCVHPLATTVLPLCLPLWQPTVAEQTPRTTPK